MQKETVVLVHGLWMNSLSQRYIARQLRNAGFNVVYFSYPTVFCSLEQNAEKLLQYLEQLALEQQIIHIAAHSLGGFVVLAALKKVWIANIGCVVLLGSPVNGSVVCKKLKRWRVAAWCFGHSLKPLCNGISIPKKYNIAVIAGDVGWGVGRFIAPISVPHDGAVGVEEVALGGSYPLQVVHASHFLMLVSKSTSETIVRYLRSHQF